MYPWYRESVSQFCPPSSMPATIKTENGYSDCMLALDYAAQSKRDGGPPEPHAFDLVNGYGYQNKKGGVWGESGGGGATNSGRCGGGGASGQQGQGLVHWMSVMAEHMNTVAAHDSPHYMWNGVEQCPPHGKDDYSWTRQSMVKQGYEAKMNENQNNQGGMNCIIKILFVYIFQYII
ncbi:zinc finger protein rotund-like isoform X1 [Halyomorpha halys]|uniref:zinc finger protein rotund-like isoform X1 n=1 Tax=Halyomorpha halys TaxID=286706 RepID=UPI0034D25BF5